MRRREFITLLGGAARLCFWEDPSAHRLQSRALDDYDPLATPEENMVALAREEQRAGYFTGPGWAPTWVGDDRTQQYGD